MELLKKIGFSLFALFLLYRSIELINSLTYNPPSEIDSVAIQWLIAFILNLFLTGVFAFLGFVFPTSRLLPKQYYRIRYPRILQSVYRMLGVKYFKYLLLLFFWGKKKNRQKYFNGTKAGLQNFIYQTHQSEFGHLAAFVAICLACVPLLNAGYVKLVLIISFINFIGNFYPIILQRHHRIRIERLNS